jgi:hypothetical protein
VYIYIYIYIYLRQFSVGWSDDYQHVGPDLIYRCVFVVGFVVNKGAVRQGLLQVLRSSLVSVIKPLLHTTLLVCRRRCIILETDSFSKNS